MAAPISNSGRAVSGRTATLRDVKLRDVLHAGGPLVGTVVSSSDPVLAERLARAFDFLWIDLEHSALGVRDAQLLAIAAKAGGAFALVRLPRHDSELVGAVLDMGVDGVVAPKVSSAAEAESVAAALRYPPGGSRGYAPRRGQVERSAGDGRLVSDVACVVQVETRAALDDLDGIAAATGVDALVVGANDLSLEIGSSLDLESAELAAAVDRVGATARDHGVPWGLAVSALPGWVITARARGAVMIVFASDLRLYSDAVVSAIERLRGLAVMPGTEVTATTQEESE